MNPNTETTENTKQPPPFPGDLKGPHKSQPDQGGMIGLMAHAAGRMTAKAALEDIRFRLCRKVESINILLNMLPSQMTPEQDEALWRFVTELR